MASQAETSAMRRAIALSRTPGVPVGPNPRVGAVLLDPAGAVIAEGYHRGAGTPHAEVDALTQAKGGARGATLVVSLEPCHHQGRTAPCSAAVLDAGVARVVFAQSDLGPVAKGGGAALAEAGVWTESGLLGDEAADTNPAWTFAQATARPFVTWKLASTVDGRSAAADGSSKWITGPTARADVHRLRATCDAILVGTGTVLADNPRLTVRDETDTPLAPAHQPLRVVVGRRDIHRGARVLDDAAPTLLVHSRDPSDVLGRLWKRNCRHVWLEGGPTLAAAFLTAGLVDEIVAYVAPVLLGSGPAAVADLRVATIDEAWRFATHDVARLGDDVRLTLRGRS